MSLAPLLLAASVAAAQAPVKGYVVRVDSNAVWLDLTAADGAAAGRAFEVYAEGPELKHPVTGASLGRAETKVAAGEIVSVSEKSSSGRLLSGPAAVKVGQRARLAGTAPEPQAATSITPPCRWVVLPGTRRFTSGWNPITM